MDYDTFADMVVLHKYLHTITTFIESIVKDEKEAIMLACEVFQEHKLKEKESPFADEGRRSQWLHLKARNLTMDHLNKVRNEGAVASQNK